MPSRISLVKKILVVFGLLLVIVFAFNFLSSSNKPQIKQITKEEAIVLVRNRKEVKEWLGYFSGPEQKSQTTGGKPIIEVDNINGENYIVHVYELLPDHTATFNWYEVNIKTGEIKQEFTY